MTEVHRNKIPSDRGIERGSIRDHVTHGPGKATDITSAPKHKETFRDAIEVVD